MQNPEHNPNQQISLFHQTNREKSLPSIVLDFKTNNARKQANHIRSQLKHLKGKINALKVNKAKSQKKTMKSLYEMEATKLIYQREEEDRQKQIQRKEQNSKYQQELFEKVSQMKKEMIKERNRAQQEMLQHKRRQASFKRNQKQDGYNLLKIENQKAMQQKKDKIHRIKQIQQMTASKLMWMNQTRENFAKTNQEQKIKSYRKQKSKDLKTIKALRKQEQILMRQAQKSNQKSIIAQYELKELKSKKIDH